MTDASVQPEGSTKRDVPSTASMAMRMLIPITAGAAASIAADTLLIATLPNSLVRAAASISA